MKHNKHLFIAYFAIVLLGVPWLINTYPQSMAFIDKIMYFAESNLAAVFSNNSITISQLHQKYDSVNNGQPKVRIILVPGHEPNFGGAEYKNIKERDLTVELAGYLEKFFNNNDHYEVVVSRSEKAWNPDLQKYFDNHWNDIKTFFNERKDEMLRLVNNGSVFKVDNGVYHVSAPQDIALRLYGINKWVNDNKVDIAIHIHFNDYPRKNNSIPGNYSGLAIYIPEKQFSNSTTTRAIADSVFKRLSKYNAVSNYSSENSGVIEEQNLIAIGSYNTVDAPSMLIEYGYIYEPQFTDDEIRSSTLQDLAFQTYLGVQDFFGGGNDVSLAYDTLMLPHDWKNNLSKNDANKTDVLALQSVLLLEGLYPPQDKTKNDCPRSGKFGPCTTDALTDFQKKYGIKGEGDTVGEKTKKVLNTKYSFQLK
jgi:N-acetylmuramoyl-L-alanine amidase